MQQQPKILCRTCRTLNEPGTRHCSNPECNSLLRITGVLYSEDPTLIRKEEAPQVSPDLEDPTLIRKKGAPQVAPVAPAVATPNRQISQNTPPLKGQSQPASPPIRSDPKKNRTVIISVIAIIVLIVACIPTGLLLSHTKIWPFTGLKPTATSQVKLPALPAGIGSKQFPNGQYAGVNDGSSYPFDTQRSDLQKLRQQAMEALQHGDSGSETAIPLWHKYLSEKNNENDAEILIYLQNQNIVHLNYVTLMVGLDFPKVVADSPDANTSTRSVLQGAYVAQKEFNDRSKDLKLRLLLVNTADDDTYVVPVAKQMAAIIKSDPTVIGILGWQTSKRTESLLEDLQSHGVTLPMVSQTASSGYLTDKHWNNLFRIAPLDKAQAQAAVLQAKKLQATNAIVFMDIGEPYSQDLGEDIQQDFEKSFPGTHPLEEDFTVEKTTTPQFTQMLKDALKKVQGPTHAVVFFTGTTDRDVGRFQDALASYHNLPAIAGDAGYVAHDGMVGRWYFVAYAYHDEWQALMGNEAPFSHKYSNAFDPENHGGGYGISIADAVAFISYDAANVLLRGVEIARSKGVVKPTGQDLQNALVTITGSNAWQGVSGLIDFDENHEAINKSLITLWVTTDDKGQGKYIKMKCIQGQFARTASNGLPQC